MDVSVAEPDGPGKHRFPGERAGSPPQGGDEVVHFVGDGLDLPLQGRVAHGQGEKRDGVAVAGSAGDGARQVGLAGLALHHGIQVAEGGAEIGEAELARVEVVEELLGRI